MADHHTIRTSEDQRLLTASLDLVEPVVDELIASCYDRLFTEHPEVRGLFPPVLDLHRERLVRAIFALAGQYDHPQDLLPEFEAMGRRHGRYGVRVEHYAALGAALLRTLAAYAGAGWTAQYQGAWVRAYTFAAATMLRAGGVADAQDEDDRLAA